MRSLSAALKAGLFAQETGEVILPLLTVTHASMSTLRFVRNQTSITSRGNTYVPYPFDALLPDDTDEGEMRVQITIDAIDRQIIIAIRSLTTPPGILLELIRAADPDTVEMSVPDCLLRSVEYDAQVITGQLGFQEDIRNEPFPQHTFTPNLFPGLFV